MKSLKKELHNADLSAICIFCILLMTLSVSAQAQTVSKPNIIFILVDDMGWTDLKSFGSSFYETPHIDKLASSGMKFTNAYSACTVCSPSRAAILTGKYPARLQLTDWILGYQQPFAKMVPPDWRPYLPLEETTIAEWLKQNGYATASIGKWHLGDDIKYYPENQGFDVNIAGTFQGSPPSYFSPYKITRLKDGPEGEYLTDRQTSEAIRYINQERNQPFFLYLPYYTVHTPLQAKKEDVEYFKNKQVAGQRQTNPVYAAMVKNLDENIGRIKATLDQLQLSANTLIIFTSDNGGLLGAKNAITSNWPLRAGKGSAYEGGTRVPAFFVWEGTIPSGTENSTPIMGIDFFPTLAHLVAPNTKMAAAVDGKNLSPLLLHQKPIHRDALYWHYPHYHPGGSRMYSAVRQNEWKLIYFYETGKKELYNLKTDLGETQDCSAKNPAKTKALFTKLLAWKKSVHAQEPSINPDFDKAREEERRGRPGKKVADPYSLN